MKVALGMPFLTFSNVDIRFAGKELDSRAYKMQGPCLLAANKRVEFINGKEHAAATLGGPK